MNSGPSLFSPGTFLYFIAPGTAQVAPSASAASEARRAPQGVRDPRRAEQGRAGDYVRWVGFREQRWVVSERRRSEEAQVDWGSFGNVPVGRASRTLSCFVLVLGHSRAMYARFFLGQRMECFLEGHVRAFEALGGVPRALLYDNLKSAVLERAGDAIRFHPRLLEAAGHYHFAPKPCAPYRGNEKGKVERTSRYLRDSSFFAARSFHGLEDMNRQLQRWVDEVAHQRRLPGDASGRTVKEAPRRGAPTPPASACAPAAHRRAAARLLRQDALRALRRK